MPAHDEPLDGAEPIDRSGPAGARRFPRRSFLKTGGAIAAGALGAGPLLAACGGSSGGGGKKGSATTLSFWNFYGPAPKSNPASDWFKTLVADWNKQNDVKVNLRYIANADYVNGSTLQTAFSSGSGPDIFLISPGDILRYYNGKALLDLSPYIKQDARDDFVKGVLNTRLVDNKIYAVPMEIEPLAMYYSVADFEKKGLSEGDLPQTWDDLLTVAGKVKGASKFALQYETAPGYYQNFTWYPFMWSGGGAAVDSSGKKSAFDQDPAIKALAFWQETQKMGLAPKKALGTGTNDAPANLGSGYTSMQLTGIWSVADLKQQKPSFQYGVFPLPKNPSGENKTDGGGWAFAANAKGGNPEAAAKFIAWALASKTDDSIQRGVNWNTVAKSNLPPRTSVQDAANAKGAFSTAQLKIFVDQVVPGLQSEPRYPPQVYKAISDAIQGAQLAGKDPESQAKQAADTINTFLSSYNGAPIL